MNVKAISLAVLVAIYPSAHAESYEESDMDSAEFFDDFYGGEELVEIATGTKKQFHLLPAVASVITADDIERMGANSIHEVINSVTGVHTYPSNVNRMNQSYSIRGIHTAENQQVLVLVNGVRTTSEFTGAKWNTFDIGVNLIDRVEILRGPGSAVYGADAFSGVINIITKGSGSLFKNDAGAKVGSFGRKSSWINLGYQSDDLKLSFNAQWQETDGDKKRVVDADRIGRSGSLDTRHEYLDIHTQLDYKGFYTNLWYLDTEGGTGAGAAQVLSDSDVSKGKQFSIQSGYKFVPTDELDIDFKLQYQKNRGSTFFKIFPDGFSSGGVTYNNGFIGAPKTVDKVFKSNIVSTYSGIAKHLIRIEVGHQTSDETSDELKNFGPGIITDGQTEQDGTLTSVKGTPYIFIGDNNRHLTYLSLQDEWAFANDWELTAGLRYDKYSDFGSTVNPRVALVWQTRHNLTTKFLYGSAYRAPTFGELYSANNPVKLGNPNLSPEKIDTVEIAFDYRPHIDWVIALNLFKYQSKDLLEYVDGQLQNASEQDGMGAEFEARWQVTPDLNVKLGYAYQDSEDTFNRTIADAPKQVIDANINYQITENVSLYADSFWILDRKRAFGDERPEIDDYIWTNLNLTYHLSEIKFNLSVRNLFNADAREPSTAFIENDYPLESRGVWLSTNYQF